MSAPHGQNSHPRRRPINGSVSPLNTHGMSLRKSGTFSSPTSLNTGVCGLENQPFMPRRSPTSTEDLEALVANPRVSQRLTDFIKDIDNRIAGDGTASTSGASIFADPDVLPLPNFVLDRATLESGPMDIDPKPSAAARSPHDHTSDSGLGPSIGGSKFDVVCAQQSSVRDSINASIASAHSAVTSSFSSLGSSDEKHTLGEYACKQIHDSIIKPILAEESLKDFHNLIRDVPRRIGEKSICNLRDLEKTLIFLAPELSATPSSYLRFCDQAIQLLHTTVEHLSEQDQRLPTDRPYTNNYFLDLSEQIRRYAAIMAATRQKESNGEELDEMDYSRDEKVTLRGGLSHNGRPLELVREKDGKVMPLSEGTDGAYKKRALSDDMDEDEVTRSMARRRKSEKPGDVMHTCRDCKKDFKRPCDLTKHEKTHSRPWKCSEEKCKYFDLGWPTEKERDRHMNDKHSAAPAQYNCHYPPCTYASKRESNCKQHMEKAHGWEYVRSKSNGRKKMTSSTHRSPSTPLTPFLGTPMSATLTTPVTPFMPSPQVPMIGTFDNFEYYGTSTPAFSVQDYQEDHRRVSVTTDGSHYTYSSGHSPPEPTSFDDAVTPEDTTINHNLIFNNCTLGDGFTTGFQQQPTPAMSNDDFTFNPLPFTNNMAMVNGVPQFSPGAQPGVTLYSPQMHVDEGFGDMDLSMNMQAFGGPDNDFVLFGEAAPSNSAMPLGNTENFFPDIDQFGGQFDNLYAGPSLMLDDWTGNNYSAQ